MSVPESQGVALLTIHCIGTAVFTSIVAMFVHLQYQRTGFEFCTNKFVAFTLAGSVFTILSEIVYMPRVAASDFMLSPVPISIQSANSLRYFNSSFLLLAGITQVVLLYLRSRALL